jgi:hypothetical protein
LRISILICVIDVCALGINLHIFLQKMDQTFCINLFLASAPHSYDPIGLLVYGNPKKAIKVEETSPYDEFLHFCTLFNKKISL